MSHAWNAEYRRWKGESVGVWSRRRSIARYGLRLCLSGKAIKVFLVLAFSQALVLSAVFFVFGQLMSPGSALIGWLESIGGTEVTAMVNAITSWALLYPEICVDGIYRIMFFFMKFSSPFLSLIIVALFVHRLIAHDMASQAIVIYNSKALTRWDYLIGKFCIVASILSVIWILPVVVSWVIGNMLSPDWSFFVHSFPSLMRGLVVGLVAVVSLSCLAMLVSSFARKTGAAVAYWVLGWLVLRFVASVASLAHPSLSYLSPLDALSTFSSGVFRMQDLLTDARSMLPFFDSFFGRMTNNNTPEIIPVSNGEVILPLLVLSLYCVISVFVVNKRISAS